MARPKGSPKLGGRKKGTPNKVTAAKEAMIAASGLTPLEYMLGILRDPSHDMEMRNWAAEKAAPYVHAKLSSIEQKIEQTNRTVVALPDQAPTVEDWKDKVSARH